MPKLICHLPNGNFIEWSTVVDAPTTYGLPRDAFDVYMRARYGDLYMEEQHPKRMERALRQGTSNVVAETLAELVEHNRAGPNETCISLEEIVALYGQLPAPDADET